MNKNFHRVVFNATRGLRMVVQETARSTGRGASKATRGSAGAAISVTAISAALMTAPLHAQIVADPSAPANQRPPVLVAPNGVPVVVIATPSAAGVSRNRFTQFDVDANGVIINNSRSTAQSQLGGFLQGNPYLAAGAARNESFLPSNQLTPEQQSSLALIDALRNSPVLGSSTYLYNVATGASAEQASTATQLANLISDIGASVVLPRTSVSPVTGQTTAAVAGGGANGGVATSGKKAVGVTDDAPGGASTPIGRGGNPLEVTPGTNRPAVINGVSYSGHALDGMQSDGIVPSVVQNTLSTIAPIPGKAPGTTAYFDSTNNITVIQNSATGNIITVSRGLIKQ